MQVQNGVDVFLGERDLLLVMPEPVVQHVNDGHHKDVQKTFKRLDEPACVVPDFHFVVTSAVSLRDDLTENYYGAG
jgi:hypothetical protein